MEQHAPPLQETAQALVCAHLCTISSCANHASWFDYGFNYCFCGQRCLTGTGLYTSLAQQRAEELLKTAVSAAGSSPMAAPSASASDTAAISTAMARLLQILATCTQQQQQQEGVHEQQQECLHHSVNLDNSLSLICESCCTRQG
jgi:hypothetical protein